MTGILLIVAVMIWLVVAFFIVKLITLRLPMVWWAGLIQMLLFLVLVPLPLVDEIVGKRQFERLCAENASIKIDPAATGKTVYLADLPAIEVQGTWVRVVKKPWRFVDANNDQDVVAYNTLQAAGGVFIRTLGISEGGAPLTFESFCAPSNRPASEKSFEALGIHYIKRPADKDRRRK